LGSRNWRESRRAQMMSLSSQEFFMGKLMRPWPGP
jgi:hypothetical protein